MSRRSAGREGEGGEPHFEGLSIDHMILPSVHVRSVPRAGLCRSVPDQTKTGQLVMRFEWPRHTKRGPPRTAKPCPISEIRQ